MTIGAARETVILAAAFTIAFLLAPFSVDLRPSPQSGNEPPVAVCSGPGSVGVGESARFDGSASQDPDRTGRWLNVTPLLRERRGLALVAFGGRLYAFGGGVYGGTGVINPVNWVEAYDPATGLWKSRSPMPTARDFPGAAVVDGRVYVIGGRSYGVPGNAFDENEVYDPVNDSWERMAPAPGRDQYRVDALGGAIYAMRLSTGDVFAYNPANDSWNVRTRFPGFPAGLPDSLRALGGRLVGAGGNFPYPKGDSWSYDPATGNWTQFATMPTGRAETGQTVYRGRLYVAGGTVGGASQVTNAFEEYDPVTDGWRKLPSMPHARDGVGSAELDDEIYVAGGRADPVFFRLVEKYSMKLVYGWDFGDGSTGAGKVVDHAYALSGTYTVTLTVTDPLGASGTDTCTVTVTLSNRPPSAAAGGPYTGVEGSPVAFDASASSDPDGDALAYRWDFTDDGTWDTAWSSSPTSSFTFGDVFVGSARVEVSDGTMMDNATAPVTILNVPPTIDMLRATAVGNLTLRVAGEKWHDITLYLNQSGVSEKVRVIRMPGSPDRQEATLTDVTIDLTASLSIVVLYTPSDDPVNGQPNGANPVWVIFNTTGGEVRLHHTFNVVRPASWVWTLDDVAPQLLGLAVHLTVTAHDPGSDDLYFAIDWGDGATASAVVYNNGVSPDPYPSINVNPITATEAFAHAYAAAGTYTIRVTVTDDDGASSPTAELVLRMG